VLLAGDHIYKMDYEPMLEQHVGDGADVTVGCIEVPRQEANGFGVVSINEGNRILSFEEKPTDPPSMPGKPDWSLVSMGIYVFETAFLIEKLRQDSADSHSSHDFGKDIIPRLVKEAKAVAHHFAGSCVRSSASAPPQHDVGTVDTYFAANLDLTAGSDLDPHDRNWPIWNYGEVTPPAKFVHDEDGRRGMAVSSLVSGGCIVSGASLRRSLLFTGCASTFRDRPCRILPYVEISVRAVEERHCRSRRADPEGHRRRGPGARRTSVPSH
jgi:glucose-1-phosphate adenylyltransferase